MRQLPTISPFASLGAPLHQPQSNRIDAEVFQEMTERGYTPDKALEVLSKHGRVK